MTEKKTFILSIWAIIFFSIISFSRSYANFSNFEKNFINKDINYIEGNTKKTPKKTYHPISSQDTEIVSKKDNEELKIEKRKEESNFVQALIKQNYNFYRYPKEYYERPFTNENKDLPIVYFKSYYKDVLIEAMKKDDFNSARMLVEKYHMTHAHFENEDNLLTMSANYGAINIMRYLLMKRYNINYRNNIGLTALHIACIRNDANMAKLLLTMGANFTIEDRDGKTAMQYVDSNNDRLNILFISYIDNLVHENSTEN